MTNKLKTRSFDDIDPDLLDEDDQLYKKLEPILDYPDKLPTDPNLLDIAYAYFVRYGPKGLNLLEVLVANKVPGFKGKIALGAIKILKWAFKKRWSYAG
jgi:hypothetical protein